MSDYVDRLSSILVHCESLIGPAIAEYLVQQKNSGFEFGVSGMPVTVARCMYGLKPELIATTLIQLFGPIGFSVKDTEAYGTPIPMVNAILLEKLLIDKSVVKYLLKHLARPISSFTSTDLLDAYSQWYGDIPHPYSRSCNPRLRHLTLKRVRALSDKEFSLFEPKWC